MIFRSATVPVTGPVLVGNPAIGDQSEVWLAVGALVVCQTPPNCGLLTGSQSQKPANSSLGLAGLITRVRA